MLAAAPFLQACKGARQARRHVARCHADATPESTTRRALLTASLALTAAANLKASPAFAKVVSSDWEQVRHIFQRSIVWDGISCHALMVVCVRDIFAFPGTKLSPVTIGLAERWKKGY